MAEMFLYGSFYAPGSGKLQKRKLPGWGSFVDYLKRQTRPSISRTLPYSTRTLVKYFLTEFFLDIVKYLLMIWGGKIALEIFLSETCKGQQQSAPLKCGYYSTLTGRKKVV
jgi:hypothetical protein